MSLYALLEPLILALVLAACCIACMRRFAPGLWRRLSGKSSPAAAKAACNSSCSSCSSCGDDGKLSTRKIELHIR